VSLTLFRRKNAKTGTPADTWYVRGTVRGQAVYETTGTDDRERAEAYKAKREAQLWDRSVFGERATTPFVQAAVSYIEQRAPTARDKRRIERLAKHFRGINVDRIDQLAADRAIAAICRPDAKPATRLRAVLIPLTAVLTFAAKRGWCGRPSFERPKQPKGRTAWLTPADAQLLLEHAGETLKPLVVFFLCTGARVAEALEMEWTDVDLGRGSCVLRETKNGRDRIVRLPPAAIAAIANLEHRKGAVFRRPDGEPYEDKEREEGGQIKTAFRNACRRAGLGAWKPAGPTPATEAAAEGRNYTPVIWRPAITPHGLRHTWATWYYAATHDALRLMHRGDWSGLQLVERYAHLATSEILPDLVRVWGAAHPDHWESTAPAARAPDVQRQTG
jgi:integrase